MRCVYVNDTLDSLVALQKAACFASRIFDRLVNHIHPLTSDDIAIQIEPPVGLAQETADFMQTMCTAAHLVARHEFHYRVRLNKRHKSYIGFR